MAKSKKELLEEAQKLDIKVTEKNTVAEIQKSLEEYRVDNEIAASQGDEAATVSDTDNEDSPVAGPVDESQTAKAGKRSAKALKEEAERQAKEERKISGETEAVKPKKPIKPTRSRLERRAKGYRKSAEQLEAGKNYDLKEAMGLAKKTSHVKFDAAVELHVKLGVDPKQADQNIRDTLVLPAGSGKSVKIAVFTDDVATAKQVGADLAGSDELLAMFDKGTTDFDVLIATPQLMSKLGKYARLLGPKGLMPNPKSGTVTTDVVKAVKEAKAGRVEYRVDSTGIVHLSIGKVSFTEAQLLENAQAVLASIRANKPQSLKGNYFTAIYLATSMGPSISVDLSSATS